MERIEAKERAAEAVEEFDAFLRSLTAAHKTSSDAIDWHAALSEHPPAEPQRSSVREAAARHALDTFTPTFLQRLFRRVEQKRAQLEGNLVAARALDDAEYTGNRAGYERALAEYQDRADLARRVVAGDAEAMLAYLDSRDPFGSVGQLGDNLNIKVASATRVIVELDVHGPDIIPKEIPRLTAAGRISLKKVPKGEYFGLYQDHVCSAVLRVGREVLALLPVESVLVTALDDLLDEATGHLRRSSILSVLLPRQTMMALNFAALDPSDSMSNFLHVVDFRRTTGFRPVTPLSADVAL